MLKKRGVLYICGALAMVGGIVGPELGAGAFPNLPTLPQLNQVPGLSSVPNLSSIPGVPSIPGITNGDQNSVTNPAQGGVFSPPFAAPGTACPGETEGQDANQPYNANDPNVK